MVHGRGRPGPRLDGLCASPPWLLKIVNHDPGANPLEHLLDKLDVLRMHLVVVLRLLAGEHRVQRHLVALIHHWPITRDHSACMKLLNSRDIPEVMIRAFNQLVHRSGLGRVSPEYDNM